MQKKPPEKYDPKKKFQSKIPFKSSSESQHSGKKSFVQPKPIIQTTTLWDFPSQHYGNEEQGDSAYLGVTPSYVIWNVLQRYTKPGDIVLDPMCGSGTTLDVCKDLNREGLGFDLRSTRADIKVGDARRLSVAPGSVDLVFIDPPYSNHIKYSGDPKCIGELDAREGRYFDEMESVIVSLYRHMKDGAYFCMYIQDSQSKGKEFLPLGFEMFLRLGSIMDPVDIISVVRRNANLKKNHWHTSAIEGNYYLRGFNYLFVFRKNRTRNPLLLKHEPSGILSSFFKRAAKNSPDEVITPDKLSQLIKEDKNFTDAKEKFKTQIKPKKPDFKKETAEFNKNKDKKRFKPKGR